MTTLLLWATLSVTAAGPARDSVQVLPVPATPPGAMTLTVEWDGRVRTLDLQRFSLRAPTAVARRYRGPGEWTSVPLPAARTYRGVLRDESAATVVASLAPSGWTIDVFRDHAPSWQVRPASASGVGAHRITGVEPETTEFSCGVSGAVLSEDWGASRRQIAGTPCLQRAQIAFDADFEYFQLKGSVIGVVDAIDAHMNLVDFYYARDVQITYELTDYVVREVPFYAPSNGGDLLDLFRAEWNTNQAGVVRDIAHLMTGKPGSLIEFGGLAWVGVVCTTSGYGWSMDNTNALGHEIGHNWGSSHCHDLAPCNNMCGGCLNVGPLTREIMIAHRDSRTCLDGVPPYATALPPYVTPEHLRVDQARYLTLGPVAFDVLANDADGNCDALTLLGHDATSLEGGVVVLSPGTGPAGRDELVYTGPTVPFVGTDTFMYEVADAGGLSTPGTVSITVDPLALEGYWPLDDGSGTAVADVTAADRHGTTVGDPAWITGPNAGALELDGDDSVTLPALHLARNHVTLTTWVRRNGSQAPFSGLLFCRDGTTVAGLHFGNANELRYTWDGAAATWGWNSGLIVPNATWVFAALVIEPDRATIYLHDGTLQSATQLVPHGVEAFDGVLTVGLDPTSAARHVVGALDDVRVYGYALSSAEILALVENGGRAAAPRPADGGEQAHDYAALTWVPGLGADTHHIYFGTDYAAVAAATPTADSYQGATSTPQFAPLDLQPETRYFWRVDEQSGATVIPGHVWQFTLAAQHHWPLDETMGTTGADIIGGLDGTFFGAPLLNQPAATLNLDRAIRFDGFNDYVQLPALVLERNSATITAWVRRLGGQTPFAGIVFTRAGGSVAGLHVGDANELRYSWNDSGSTWGWNSGLVLPDNTWVFTALVLRPDSAVLYLGNNGGLTSSVNPVSHAAEEFDGVANIGRDPASGRYFDGWIDDVHIYRAALTATEIHQLYDRAFCTVVTYGDATTDGVVDLADILCALDGYQGALNCPFETLDLAPCGGDGQIDLDDLLAILDSFAGQPRCPDPCLE